MRRHFVVGKIFQPLLTRGVIGVILHPQKNILFTAAAHQVDVRGKARIFGKEHGVLAQAFVEKIGIKLAVTEMIGAVKISAQRGHAVDDFPKLFG